MNVITDELSMHQDSANSVTSKLTIYYDGNCPLCLAEIHLLRHHNHKQLLDFVSIQELDTSTSHINCDLALQTIHARLGDNLIIVGPTVFFEAYKRTDLSIINYFFSFTITRFFYTKFYAVFAKYRHQISRLVGSLLLNLVQKKYHKKLK